MGSPTAHMKRNAASHCESSRIAKTANDALANWRAPLAHVDACQTATLADEVRPDLLDTALVPLDAKLHDDVDEHVQQALDVVASELSATAALLDQQHKLL